MARMSVDPRSIGISLAPLSDPEMRRALGHSLHDAGAVAPRDDRGVKQRTRSRLQDQFPEPRAVSASFRRLDLAAEDAPPTGSVKWLSLINVDLASQLGQDVLPFKLTCDLASPDVDGAGSGDAIAWGTVEGLEAAIVFGRDLPIGDVGTWTDAPAGFLGIDNTEGVQSVLNRRLESVVYFPPGKLTNAIPGARRTAETWAPWAYRLRESDRLQVAFVTRGNNFGAGVDDELFAKVFVQVHFGVVTMNHLSER